MDQSAQRVSRPHQACRKAAAPGTVLGPELVGHEPNLFFQGQDDVVMRRGLRSKGLI